MPRTAAPNSWTCLSRKVKCDGALPTCLRCQKQDLFCDRSSELKIKHSHSHGGSSDSREVLNVGTSSPKVLLQQHLDIARLFHIYIKELAPWYDLNGSSNCSFGTTVPYAALDCPLLFAAIIAFAGTYAFRKYRSPTDSTTAEAYHSQCIKLLISLTSDEIVVVNGSALAATCLLRSYEILAERDDPNRHLFGASTLVPAVPGLYDRGLLAASFWNYLREDITYSLVYECPLKMQVRLPDQEPVSDDDHANSISLLLAVLINSYFGDSAVDISSFLQRWKTRFPAIPFSRVEGGPFPAVRMLKDCQVAALHYYHVALCMVAPERRQSSAAEICGLAMNAESDAVIVNAYGPICFSAKWLAEGTQKQHLVRWLRNTQKRTAWSVEVLVSKLQQSWSNRDPENVV